MRPEFVKAMRQYQIDNGKTPKEADRIVAESIKLIEELNKKKQVKTSQPTLFGD